MTLSTDFLRWRVGLVGYGEVGRILAEDLREQGVAVAAYDLKLDGRRRAEEVREVAATVRDIGLEPWSAAGTAERQAWVADLVDLGLFGDRRSKEFARNTNWRVEADRILHRVRTDTA
jgi:Domain of unknown function (DUF1932)